jgi:glutaredoxin
MVKKYKIPYENGYTIYSISNCKYCTIIHDKIKSINPAINCDKYLKTARDRDYFYKFIEEYTKKPYKYFPMIFYNGVFIGGYKEWLESNSR